MISPGGGQFQAIERALAGQGLAAVATSRPGLAGGVGLADDGGQQGVVPQVVVVVEVFIAQGQAVDPLGEQFFDGVLDEVGVAMIGEAAGELAEDAGDLLDLAEQQCPAVGGDVAAVEIGEDFSSAEHGKVEEGGVTLCLHRAASGRCRRSLW